MTENAERPGPAGPPVVPDSPGDTDQPIAADPIVGPDLPFLSGAPAEPDAMAVAAPAAAPVPAARAGLFWWLTLVIIAADQITKVIVNNAVSMFETKVLVPGLVNLAHVRNEGVAFGLFNDFDLEHKWVFTTLLALGALVGITFYARHIRPEERLARIGLSLILGGAIGNLIDRVRQGYVLDFVDVYVGDWHFWAFNVADAAVSVGAVFVFIDLLFVRSHVPDSV